MTLVGLGKERLVSHTTQTVDILLIPLTVVCSCFISFTVISNSEFLCWLTREIEMRLTLWPKIDPWLLTDPLGQLVHSGPVRGAPSSCHKLAEILGRSIFDCVDYCLKLQRGEA